MINKTNVDLWKRKEKDRRRSSVTGAADPELSAGKNVGGEHMKKRHFVLFWGQFFTNFARFYYNWDGTIEAWI